MTDPKCEIWDGSRFWYNDVGKLHRLDGPALEWSYGANSWWIEGKLHRLDGPAVERGDGSSCWYVNDKTLSKEEFARHPLVIFYRLCKEVL